MERVGVDNPRKDLRKWADFRPAYGFFFPDLFTPVADPTDERIASLGVAPPIVQAFLADFADGYQSHADQGEWFDQVRQLAAKHGFARNHKEYKADSDAYPGSIREESQLVRVALTGSTRRPDLHAVAITLGPDEVQRRIRPTTG